MSATRQLRRLWLKVHLWLGLGLALAVIPLAASGAALVWRGELERLLEPQRFSAMRDPTFLPPSTYLDAGRHALGPHALIVQLRYPEHGGDPVIVVSRTADGGLRAAWLDPASAALRDVGDPGASLLGRLHDLHGNLMVPEVGRSVVGWLGWAMFASAATGLWLWWPQGGMRLRALRWRRSPSTALNLHHATGFWLCVPLSLVALTGVYIAFPKMAGAISPQAEPAGVLVRVAAPVDIDEALAVARRLAAPDAQVARIATPAGSAGSWKVMFGGASPLLVETPVAGGVTKIGPWGAPLTRTVRSLHDGGGAGLAWRVVLFATGIAPVLLAMTGLTIWLRRQTRKWRASS